MTTEANVSIKMLVAIAAPILTAVLAIGGGIVTFTKIEMITQTNTAQTTAIEQRLDRFQGNFEQFRALQDKENRDRDRQMERSTAINEAQNERLIASEKRYIEMYDRIVSAYRRLEDRVGPRPNGYIDPLAPVFGPPPVETRQATLGAEYGRELQ